MSILDHDHMPPVSAVMTPFPYFVRPDDSVSRVIQLIERHAIRHVPVKQDEHVVGIVFKRDLRWLAGPELPTDDPETVAVRDVLIPDPYIVELNTPLGTVVRTMAERKIATVVVVRSGKLAGIVTVTDICRAMADLLETRFGQPGPTDAA